MKVLDLAWGLQSASLAHSCLEVRNAQYQRALQAAISSWMEKGVIPSVLDIGAGASLLSLCAWEAGARPAYACEGRKGRAPCAFAVGFISFYVINNLAVSAPMCSIARAVLRCNGVSPADLPVINKYSTALSLTPPIADLASPPHIIVTETADAGLLGEYMLPTLLHAANHLALPSSFHPAHSTTLIPASAVVYAALVEHESLLRMSSAKFFSSQLRSDEAYSCGKLPDGASVLTPSFVGEQRIAKLFCGPPGFPIPASCSCFAANNQQSLQSTYRFIK
jgi:hypothetical protein